MIPLTEPWPILQAHPAARAPEIRVCHFMSADLWAGAEVQLRTVASYLVERPEILLTAVLLNEGRLAFELRRMGIEVAVIDERRHTSVAIVAFLARFLRTRGIEVLHTHRYKDTVLGTVAAKLAGVPKIVRTVHGLAEPLTGWERMKFCAYSAVEKVALRSFADRVIAVSRNLARTLEADGDRRSAVVPIHNGIDVAQARPTQDAREVRRQLGIPGDARVFGTIGRLSAVKDHRTLLCAAQRVLHRQRNARFLFVGDGPLRDDLVLVASQLGIAHACVFAGARDDSYDVLAVMDVFVLSSLHEGIPMALLEAMALAKPVVVTAVGGVPEIVSHGENGLLVTPRDDRAFADACLEIASRPGLAAALGSAARRSIQDRFSHATGGKALLDVYQSLVEGERGKQRLHSRDLSALRLAWELTSGVVRIGGRRISRTITHRRARHAMNRIRRTPSQLRKILQSAKTVLVVCHGNIIRSAFAAELLRQRIGAGVRIHSAGLAAVTGAPSHPSAIRIAASCDVDLASHVASPLGADAIAKSDVIFVMEVSQLVAMHQHFPEARTKTFLLTCLASDTPLEIGDPVDGDDSRFRTCFNHISQAVDPIVGELHAVAMVS
jgi:L-malate glycosyltransferase